MNVAAVLPLLAQVSTTAETSYPELVLPSRAGDTYDSSNGAYSRLPLFDMFRDGDEYKRSIAAGKHYDTCAALPSHLL